MILTTEYKKDAFLKTGHFSTRHIHVMFMVQDAEKKWQDMTYPSQALK